jgi:hypothetical protein
MFSEFLPFLRKWRTVVRIVDSTGDSECDENRKVVFAVLPIASGVFPELGATESGFHFRATAKDFFALSMPLRGIDPTPSHVVRLRNYTPGDVSWPAATSRWGELIYFDSGNWLNESSATVQSFCGCPQPLGMKSFSASHTSALRDLTPCANDMIPVLQPTAAAGPGDENEAARQLRAGIVGFLNKPPFAAIRRARLNSLARF